MEDETLKKLPRSFPELHDDSWLLKMRMEALLGSKGFLPVILRYPSHGGDTDARSDEKKLKISKTLMYLVQCLEDTPLQAVASERRNPIGMYCKLKEWYATEKKSTRLLLNTTKHKPRFNERRVKSD